MGVKYISPDCFRFFKYFYNTFHPISVPRTIQGRDSLSCMCLRKGKIYSSYKKDNSWPEEVKILVIGQICLERKRTLFPVKGLHRKCGYLSLFASVWSKSQCWRNKGMQFVRIHAMGIAID